MVWYGYFCGMGKLTFLSACLNMGKGKTALCVFFVVVLEIGYELNTTSVGKQPLFRKDSQCHYVTKRPYNLLQLSATRLEP